jgi:GTP-binding protein YchF
MKIGIVGLPQVGKTTVFRLATGQHEAPAGPAGPEGAQAVVRFPDPRLTALARMHPGKKMVQATASFVDSPPLTRGAGRGEGLGSAVLTALRQADALLHVVRAFEEARIPHIEGSLDPARDIALLATEFLLADLEVAEKRILRIEEALRKGRKDQNPRELAVLRRGAEALQAERPLRDLDLPPGEERLLRGFQFLTAKPLLLLVNVGEEDLGKEEATLAGLKSLAGPRVALLALAAKTELEVARLDPEDAAAFRRELGLAEPGAARLLRSISGLLGLLTFFTVGEDEVRAWTLRRGASALEAAGTIHTDFAKGFIKAEVVPFAALAEVGSLAAARKKGMLRLEGKDYPVVDGDVITIRFSV